jgi:hypothetical protein
MVIRHGEAYTMCKHLTVKNADGTDAYRPTVHYAYCPSNEAIASVHELKMRDWEMQPKQRLLNDDIISGRDELGVLLLGHDFTGWWTGSLLSIDEARKVLPHQSATTLQVAASIVSAIQWMFVSPSSGVCVPDDLPHEFILEKAKPYLGTQFSGPTDWNPLRTRKDIFDQWADHNSVTSSFPKPKLNEDLTTSRLGCRCLLLRCPLTIHSPNGGRPARHTMGMNVRRNTLQNATGLHPHSDGRNTSLRPWRQSPLLLDTHDNGTCTHTRRSCRLDAPIPHYRPRNPARVPRKQLSHRSYWAV